MKQIMQKWTPKNRQKLANIAFMSAIMGLMFFGPATPVWAAGGDVAKTVVQQIVEIIETIFQAIGAILLVYSIGQLILAFKNEDGDSKSRASSMLVVAAFLIGFPALIDKLGLTSLIPS